MPAGASLLSPQLALRFHYFALRKMHFLLRAKALVVFPGGYGTLDELFEALNLIVTHEIRPIPIVLVGKDYYRPTGRGAEARLGERLAKLRAILRRTR